MFLDTVAPQNPTEGNLSYSVIQGPYAELESTLCAGRSDEQKQRWAILLAGGDGTRLLPLTRIISSDARPKQFCPLAGSVSLLEETRQRAARSVRTEQILVSLTSKHKPYFLAESGLRPAQRIVQPSNKGTAPPVLHALLSIQRLDEDAIVAILPCDHHYSDESVFTSTLESAFEIAGRSRSVVLLGARPEGPEVEYGWIELGPRNVSCPSFQVTSFWEKPSAPVAKDLFLRGALWNTFVLVGPVSVFLAMINTAIPELLSELRGARLWEGDETYISNLVYQRMCSFSLSGDVLAIDTRSLTALAIQRCVWSDLGNTERVVAVLESLGAAPSWLHEWKELQRGAPCPVRAPLRRAPTA